MTKALGLFILTGTLAVAAAEPVVGAASKNLPALRYQGVECVYSISDKESKRLSQNLMTLVIETDLGRFAQLQFGDETLKIQYQILLENDTQVPGSVNVLQNLAVGELESSAEFSAQEPRYVRLAQGVHSVRCELKSTSKID